MMGFEKNTHNNIKYLPTPQDPGFNLEYTLAISQPPFQR